MAFNPNRLSKYDKRGKGRTKGDNRRWLLHEFAIELYISGYDFSHLFAVQLGHINWKKVYEIYIQLVTNRIVAESPEYLTGKEIGKDVENELRDFKEKYTDAMLKGHIPPHNL